MQERRAKVLIELIEEMQLRIMQEVIHRVRPVIVEMARNIWEIEAGMFAARILV